MPAFDDVLSVGAVVFGIATWIFPLLRLAWPWNKRPPSSLAAVGRVIGTLVVTACLSAVGLLLALLTFVFSQRTSGAWLGLSAIAAFWVSFGVLICIGGLRARAAPSEKADKS